MVKKRKKFNYNKDRRRAFKKSKKQKKINCQAVRQAWDDKKTLKMNMKELGLVENPNEAFRIAKTLENMPGAKSKGESSDIIMTDDSSKETEVVKALVKEAGQRCDPAKLDLLSEPECMYITRLMDKYGDNYKAMARDSRNFYQYTPSQIRNKIKKFKATPKHYQAYLESQSQPMDVAT